MSVLEARGVSFAYPGAERVLDGVSLRVESGERVALHAPSGAGKSTMCQLLAGYLSPQKGEVLLDDEPLAARPGAPCPVQLVWQQPVEALDPYLRLGRSLAEAGDADEGLLDALGIERGWLARFPHELSGGQLQRVCIARALTARPRFLIADEVSTMLDALTQAQIWSLLTDWCEDNGAGMVLVTHSSALQERLATRVMEL